MMTPQINPYKYVNISKYNVVCMYVVCLFVYFSSFYARMTGPILIKFSQVNQNLDYLTHQIIFIPKFCYFGEKRGRNCKQPM